MKFILTTILSSLFIFASAQHKSLIKDIKEAGKYTEHALSNAENMLENIEDALNAVDHGEARLYVEQSTYELENLQASVGYAQDELLDINKIPDDKGGIDIKLMAGEMEDKCLLAQSYSNSLFSYLSDAMTATDLTSLLLKFGSARSSCENIIIELKQAMEIHSSLTEMVNPEE
ncbi:MAG: hypothetical protein H8E61_04905 [Bacteroidetes bacterium]|nr:hypothetical protein [Bacteroidota bacterium]